MSSSPLPSPVPAPLATPAAAPAAAVAPAGFNDTAAGAPADIAMLGFKGWVTTAVVEHLRRKSARLTSSAFSTANSLLLGSCTCDLSASASASNLLSSSALCVLKPSFACNEFSEFE